MDTVEMTPTEVLDEWLDKYGHSRHRHPDGNCLMYARYDAYDDDKSDWVAKWIPLCINPSLGDAIQLGFIEAVNRMREDHEADLGERCAKLGALLVLAYGEGRIMRNPATASKPDSEIRADLLALTDKGTVPTRVIEVVTHRGMAGESSLFYDDTAPHVEKYEIMLNDGEPTATGHVKAAGALNEYIVSAFTILTILNSAVEAGSPPNILGLAEQVRDYQGTLIGKHLADLLREFATFIEEEEFDDEDTARDLAAETRRILDTLDD